MRNEAKPGFFWVLAYGIRNPEHLSRYVATCAKVHIVFIKMKRMEWKLRILQRKQDRTRRK